MARSLLRDWEVYCFVICFLSFIGMGAYAADIAYERLGNETFLQVMVLVVFWESLLVAMFVLPICAVVLVVWRMRRDN